MIVMYALTSILCNISLNGIEVTNQDAINETTSVIKFIFTPLNAMILLSSVGNVFGKVKEEAIETEKANRRLLLIVIAFVIILIFESNYIGSFIHGLLG